MSQPSGTAPDSPARRASGYSLRDNPNAEKYVLEADAMRRRQMRSALLHGSDQTWREYRRIWPAVVIGIIVAAVIVAGLAVTGAFKKTEENQRKQEQQRSQSAASVRTA